MREGGRREREREVLQQQIMTEQHQGESWTDKSKNRKVHSDVKLFLATVSDIRSHQSQYALHYGIYHTHTHTQTLFDLNT